MPLYDFSCDACGIQHIDVVRSLADYGKPYYCSKCGKPMRLLLAAPMIVMDYPGYQCPITGTWIEGRRAHRENLKKHGCRVLESGEKEAAVKYREAEDAALDAALEQTIGAAIEAMPPRKQEQLYQELQAGAGFTVERK